MQNKNKDNFSDWERETKTGNLYFSSNKFEQAQNNYFRAKKIAIKLFKDEKENESAVVALVVSYHNLAELYKKQNELNLAYMELNEIDSYLVTCLENGNNNLMLKNAVQN